jgi:hypothetical protein
MACAAEKPMRLRSSNRRNRKWHYGRWWADGRWWRITSIKAKPTSPAPRAAKPAKKPGRKAAVKTESDAVTEIADSVSAEA